MIPSQVWRARRDAHEARADALVADHRARSRRGERHAVEDFLFTYYAHRPAQLRRWSPGWGVVLEDAAPHDLGRHGVAVEGGAALAPPPDRVVRAAAWTASLLRRSGERRARYDCFGLHEWAMVHRTPQSQVRHSGLPLRLGEEATTALVEALPLRCTHFDAFRFFAP
ncbi:MAG TPA: 3-methyladenine DNA glycosylase, partial [Mycobacteriales bacterium]|nr:3-methyladenine DNA glycosylase [Mycobacteriales bacterium]